VFDVKLLDRMSFGDLRDMLDTVLETMVKVDEESPEGHEDPRNDQLMVIANQIIMRMDSIVREYGRSNPETLAQWEQVAEDYKKGFKDYSNTYLKDGVPLVMARQEPPPQAPPADAARLAELEEIVLDEKLLEGMNAGDLFEVNRFITEKVEQLQKELPEDVAEPLIGRLLKFGITVIRRLDPLMRETYRDSPESLAGWEAIMNDYKDLDDEGGGDALADIESSEIS
jgi:hypothetical protein